MSAVPAPAAPSTDNPLLEPSPLPLQLPPFAEITLEHCREALLAGMAEQRAEVAAIVASTEPPTFENTIEALERVGRAMERVSTVYGVWGSTMSTPEARSPSAASTCISRSVLRAGSSLPLACRSSVCARSSKRCSTR